MAGARRRDRGSQSHPGRPTFRSIMLASRAMRSGDRLDPSPELYTDAFMQHERFLWALLYRLTGCAADADDLVQETFVRAIERPPRRTDESWRPWLVCVALNLGRDLLRRRKRRAYVGPWL